jgi:hypothetical protein
MTPRHQNIGSQQSNINSIKSQRYFESPDGRFGKYKTSNDFKKNDSCDDNYKETGNFPSPMTDAVYHSEDDFHSE